MSKPDIKRAYPNVGDFDPWARLSAAILLQAIDDAKFNRKPNTGKSNKNQERARALSVIPDPAEWIAGANSSAHEYLQLVGENVKCPGDVFAGLVPNV